MNTEFYQNQMLHKKTCYSINIRTWFSYIQGDSRRYAETLEAHSTSKNKENISCKLGPKTFGFLSVCHLIFSKNIITMEIDNILGILHLPEVIFC